MGKLQKTQNRKPGRRSSCPHRCSVCRYTSSRRYNIVRHEFRIHSASTRPRKCCGLVFRTKGEYYLHCEENHPDSRPNHKTSRKKYKIFPGLNIPTEPTSLVTSSPKRPEVMRYMLRSRVRPETYNEDTEDSDEIEVPELATPKSESADESELDEKPPETVDNSPQSSGYETKTTINSTFDSTEESRKTKLSFCEERDKRETPPHERSTCLDLKSENAGEMSNESSPIKFLRSDETAAGHGGKSPRKLQKTSDELNVTEHQRNNEGNVNSRGSPDFTGAGETPESSNSNVLITAESKGTKITSENETKENDDPRKLFASTPHQLPPKKRILQSLGFWNRENVANGINAVINRTSIGDRLRPSKPSRPEESPLRRKRRSSRKLKARKLRETINLSRFSSSDAENDSPQTARKPRASGTNVEPGDNKTARKPKAPGIDVDLGGNIIACKLKVPEISVDLRTNGRFCWEETTRVMREYLPLIDFDSFKVILP